MKCFTVRFFLLMSLTLFTNTFFCTEQPENTVDGANTIINNAYPDDELYAGDDQVSDDEAYEQDQDGDELEQEYDHDNDDESEDQEPTSVTNTLPFVAMRSMGISEIDDDQVILVPDPEEPAEDAHVQPEQLKPTAAMQFAGARAVTPSPEHTVVQTATPVEKQHQAAGKQRADDVPTATCSPDYDLMDYIKYIVVMIKDRIKALF